MIASLTLGPKARQQTLAACARNIAYTQRRNAAARRCHRRATLRRLHQLGIRLADLCRCQRE
jgi:hypothetical protein